MFTTARHTSLVGIGLLGAAVLVSAAGSKPDAVKGTQTTPVQRGAYLVLLGGCNDCHTPKVIGPDGPDLDKSRLLSGHPAADTKLPAIPAGTLGPDQWGALTSNDFTTWAGPWGVSYSANLTPDVTGLSSWTAEIFIRAMRSGKHAGAGRPILPPMPWETYAQMTDADLRAVFAYLQTLPPIRNVVPLPLPPAS